MEILVVIAIIGILASIVLGTVFDALEESKYAAAEQEVKQIQRIVNIAQNNTGKTLGEITGSYCTKCAGSCANSGGVYLDLKNLPESDACFVEQELAYEKIMQASEGLGGDLMLFRRDPWGSPYLIDENEGEYANSPCRKDTVQSPGPDGIRAPASQQDPDDLYFHLPFTLPSCTF